MDPKLVKHKIAFAGLDVATFNILNTSSHLDLRIVADISNQFGKTINPFNLVFYLIYYLKKSFNLPYLIQKILIVATLVLEPFLTKSYRKFKPLLVTCLKKTIAIVDFSKEKTTKEIMEKEKIELLIVNTWSILPETIFLAPSRGSLNIHPSKLPQYKGALPTLWSLKNKDEESAVTVFVINKDMDNGSLVSQHIFNIEPTDNSLMLEDKIHKVLESFLVSDILKYLNNQLQVNITSTDIPESKTARYEDYREIHLKKEFARDIVNKIILYPHLDSNIYCFIVINKRKIFIKKAKILDLNTENSKTSVTLSRMCIVCKSIKGTFSARLFVDIGARDSLWFLFSFKSMYNLGK